MLSNGGNTRGNFDAKHVGNLTLNISHHSCRYFLQCLVFSELSFSIHATVRTIRMYRYGTKTIKTISSQGLVQVSSYCYAQENEQMCIKVSTLNVSMIQCNCIFTVRVHCTCGINSLLHFVNLILFTLLLVHLILYAYHLITVTTFALITYHCLIPFTPDLKLISFTNPFLHSHSYSFRTDFTDLNLY